MSKTELASISQRVAKKYRLLTQFIEGVAKKKLPGMAVAGERGLGKSFTIMEILDQYTQDQEIKKVSGHITPLALYNLLYEYRDRDCIIWFDDCDSAITERESLNILKAAMDTLPKRIVTWSSSSSLVEVPEFQFKGRVIVSTNIKLGQSPHLEAFLDRVQWYGISLTLEEKFCKISEIAKNYPDSDPKVTEEVLNWIQENLQRIGKKMSLRTFVKVMGLASFSTNWKELAEAQIEQDAALMKEAEEASQKLARGKKVGTTVASVNPKEKAAKRVTEGYKPGSTLGILFDKLKSGKPVETRVLLNAIKDQTANPKARLEILAKDGAENGAWTIKEDKKNGVVQMLRGKVK